MILKLDTEANESLTSFEVRVKNRIQCRYYFTSKLGRLNTSDLRSADVTSLFVMTYRKVALPCGHSQSQSLESECHSLPLRKGHIV